MDNPNLKDVYLWINDANYSEAFEKLTELLENNKVSCSSEISELFLMVLTNFCEKLEKNEQITEMFECYGRALELCPQQKSRILDELAKKLIR